MDQTHLHLLTNHIPVIGTIIGLFVLLYGIIKKSDHTKNAAYLIFILCAAGGAVAYFTGEPAEETVEEIAGISKAMIESHEDAGKFAFISMVVLGLTSVVGLILSFRKSSLAKGFSYLMVLLAAISFGIAAYTANLGGKIRHTEIQNNSPVPDKEDSD